MIQTEMRKFFHYEEAKKQIFTQLVGKERYQQMLAEVPHREIEDMAVIYRGLISVEEGQIVSFPVTDQIFSFYGISLEQFHEDAVRNTQRIFPAVLQPLMAEIEELTGIMEDPAGLSQPEKGEIHAVQVLRNNYGLYGASAVLNPEVMERCGRETGENFYLLPSSIHEMLLIPESQALDIQKLQDIVKSVNRSEAILPKDILTDSVYHYDVAARTFELAENYEQRMRKTRKGPELPLGERSVLKELEGIRRESSQKKQKEAKSPLEKNTRDRER